MSINRAASSEPSICKLLAADGKKDVRSMAVMGNGKIATIVVDHHDKLNKLFVYDVGGVSSWEIPASFSHILLQQNRFIALAGVTSKQLEMGIYHVNGPAKIHRLKRTRNVARITDFNMVGDYFVLIYINDAGQKHSETREYNTMRRVEEVDLSDETSQSIYNQFEKAHVGYLPLPQINKIISWCDQEVVLWDTANKNDIKAISQVRSNVTFNKQNAFMCCDGRVIMGDGYCVYFPEVIRAVARLTNVYRPNPYNEHFAEVDITERSALLLKLEQRVIEVENENRHLRDEIHQERSKHMAGSSVMFAPPAKVEEKPDNDKKKSPSCSVI